MTTTTRPTKRGNRMIQLRFSMLMLVVAGVAGICAAGRFYLTNHEIGQSMITQQLHALASGSQEDRRDAARLLDGVAPAELHRVAPALMIAMNDADPTVRDNATRSLAMSMKRSYDLTRGEAPPQSNIVVGALIAALKDPDANVRASAARGLEGLAVTHRKSGKTTLLDVDPQAAIEALTRTLDDPDPNVAGAACQGLTLKLGTDPASIVPVLERMAREGDSGNRSYAVLFLGQVKRQQGEPPNEILAFLDDDNPHVRKAALRALHPPWRDADRVAIALVRMLDQGQPQERAEIVVTLSTINPMPDEAVPAIVRAMENENRDVADRFDRQNILDFAAVALGNAAPEKAKAAIPALVNAAKRQARESGSTTAFATILAIDPKNPAIDGLVESLVAAIRDEKTRGDDRVSLFNTLQMAGPDRAALAFNALRETLAELYDPRVHPEICGILANMGASAKAALPDLRRVAIEGFDNGRFDMSAPVAMFTIDPDSREVRDYVLHVAGKIADEADPPSRKFALDYLSTLNANHLSLTGRLIMVRDGGGSGEEKTQAETGMNAIDRLLQSR